jgi:hypothetical protein
MSHAGLQDAAVPASRADWEALDRRAWACIREWPRHARFDPLRDGLDHADLTCWFLWDKVGRALRRDADPEGHAAECALLGWHGDDPVSAPVPLRPDWAARWAALRRRARAWRQEQRLRRRPARAAGPARILVPVPTPRLARAVEALLGAEDVAVFAPHTKACTIAGAVEVPYPSAVPPPDAAFAAALHAAVLRGLEAQGVRLATADAATLGEQILTQQRQLAAHARMLATAAPDLLLVHADNHPTPQHFVLLARRAGVPVAMLQHGLDCEHHYLDDAYADAIAVWGEARATRYRRDAARPPRSLAVTGNPEYDGLRPAAAPADTTGDWLWVTRPHAPAKCYAPSRSVLEGVRILDALTEALRDFPGRRLLIKPHPYDSVEALRAAAAAGGMGDRIEFVDTPPMALYPRVGVVISEDSTAGMEAMFFGRALVHAHFAPARPTLPFADYGAGLAGFDPAGLRAALAAACTADEAKRGAMHAGQARFLRDFAGPCDGQSAARVLAFLRSLIGDLR